MWRVTAVLVTTEFLDVSLNTVIKAAMSRGMNDFVLVVYSNIFAIFILGLSSLIFYRKRSHPPRLTRTIIYRILLLSLLSCCGQVFTYIGIKYSSPTMASAMIDLTPAFTFVLAIISRMEKLDLKLGSSRAKSIGTIISITGALIVTLYKGLPITCTHSSTNTLQLLLRLSNWVIGALFLAAHSAILSLYFVVQTWILRDYPAEITVTLICCIFVTIQSSMLSLVIVGDSNDWILKSNMEFISIGYTAVFAVALRSVIHAWALRKKGPVYVSLFKPLGMVIALVMGIIFLGDTLYLGSLIGAAVIALGFYCVTWGKAREDEMEKEQNGGVHGFDFEASSPNKIPLLLSK